MGKENEAVFEEAEVKELPAEKTEEVDDFDYKGTLESLKDDPVFARRFLGEGEEISVEELADLILSETVELDTMEEAKEKIAQILKDKIDDVADSELSRRHQEREEENRSRETRKKFKDRLKGLGALDEAYAYDFGDTEEDYIPLDDEKFSGSQLGKLVHYLSEKGYTDDQLNDLTDEELYAIGVRISGGENKLLRELASVKSTKMPVVKSSAAVSSGDGGKKMLRDLYMDKNAWNKEVDRALDGKDKKRYEEMKNYEKSVLNA